MTFSYLYLNDVVESQGELFQYVYKNGLDLVNFAKSYMKSKIKGYMDRGNPIPLNWNGYEIYEELGLRSVNDILPYDTRSDWFGQFLALLQYRTRIDSAKLDDIFDFSSILDRYNTLHDLDLELAVKKLIDAKGLTYYGD